MTDKVVKTVKISELKKAGYNPPKRIKDVVTLKKSIEEIGLQYPILVTKKNEVVDGHRRIAVCEELGWDEVPVIVTNTDRDKAYAGVNSTGKFMSGNDILHVFFSHPEALTANSRARVETVCEVIGRKLVESIMKKGNTLRMYYVAKKAAVYCDQKNNEFIKKAVRWVMKNGPSILEQAVQFKAPISVIVKAIKNGTELKSVYTEGQ